jgi:cell division protein FtsI (penicillin-binding protein 3)
MAGALFGLSFLIVAARVTDLTAFTPSERTGFVREAPAPVATRGDIRDRNGILLATSLPTASLYADPREVIDAEGAADRLAAVFPDLDRDRLAARLGGDGRFVWVRRNLIPDEQHAVNLLGIPGLGFVDEERRVYPQGTLAAHVLGLTDVDGHGIAGVEKSFDRELGGGEGVRLSIDLRIQNAMREELAAAVREFRAVGAAGLVLDIHTGELLAAVSLPDFDPNAPAADAADGRFNRVTTGVYEMGSTFKLFTVAMGLDTGVTSLSGGYDASRPLRVARHTISDYHAKNRWLSVPEILVYSSNIGAAQMAMQVGGVRQRDYLGRLGLLGRASIELPEVGAPLKPTPWRDINTMTVSFGHGIAVSPLQLTQAVAAVVNGGILRPTTVIALDGAPPPAGERVFSAATSRKMRALMRLVVRYGTGGGAEVAGYKVGGKTGTAEKLIAGRYRRDKRISSFVGAFPMDAPRYVVLAIIDEPKGNKRTYNYATGGWVAAPVVGAVVRRMAPMLGLAPVMDDDAAPLEYRTKKLREQALRVAIVKTIATVRGTQLASN